MALVHRELIRQVSSPSARLKISQIKLTREPENEHKWTVELVGADGTLI
jgi:hypothetical protein